MTQDIPPTSVAAPAPTTPSVTLSRENIIAAIKPVLDPELFISIVDLGLIYDAIIQDIPSSDAKEVVVKMTLTSPGCPAGPQLLGQTHAAVARMPGVGNVRVDLVWSPPWNPVEMASEDAKEKLGIW